MALPSAVPFQRPSPSSRRYGVAHNSTGPTSVSIDLEIRKGAGPSSGRSLSSGPRSYAPRARSRPLFPRSGDVLRPDGLRYRQVVIAFPERALFDYLTLEFGLGTA